jgi:hypothetical protein
MLKKMLVLAGALALSTLLFAGDKTYKINFSAPCVAGAAQLPAGEYKLELKGSIAFFTDEAKHKSFTTPAKVETVEKKYEATTAETTKDGDTTKVKAIRLGGGMTRVIFD